MKFASGWWGIWIGLLSVITPTWAAEPGNWPNWLGPKWDGISHETGWATTWPAEGLPVRWTKEIGIGFSSISLAEGLLYTAGYIDGHEIV